MSLSPPVHLSPAATAKPPIKRWMGQSVKGWNLNSKYYLYNGQFNWTASASRFFANEAKSNVWYLDYSGALADTYPVSWQGARPVINLNANVKIVSGSGTKNDPYIIEI